MVRTMLYSSTVAKIQKESGSIFSNEQMLLKGISLCMLQITFHQMQLLFEGKSCVL